MDIITNHQWVVGAQHTSTSSVQKLRENFSCHVISHLIPGKPTTTTHLSKVFSYTYSSSFLSDFVKILPLVNCLPPPINVKRDPFSNFSKRKNPIFQKKSFAVFSLILWENEILHYLFRIRMYHWWLQKNTTIEKNEKRIRKKIWVKKVFLSSAYLEST